MFTRRGFLGVTGSASLASASALGQNQTSRKRIAIVTTTWHYLTHAQHMGDRFLVGYPHEGKWHRPEIDVVSLFVDQRNTNDQKRDQSTERAETFGFKVYPTIAQTLRAGTNALAVDGVLLIGEHGKYDRNEKGQVLYPRYEFFEQIVNVFREDRRSVAVFNDKHLSYSFEKAKQMVQWSKELRFPLMAGSSLPVTFRLPSVEMPFQCDVDEALMVGVGGSDAMDFHAMEAMQCMLERRKGGEVGVKSVQLIDGEEVWEAGNQGRFSNELLAAALSRSNELQGISRSESKPQNLLRDGRIQQMVAKPSAYFIEYRDGLKATLLMLNGAVGDYTFAAKIKGQEKPISTLFYLPPTPNRA